MTCSRCALEPLQRPSRRCNCIETFLRRQLAYSDDYWRARMECVTPWQACDVLLGCSTCAPKRHEKIMMHTATTLRSPQGPRLSCAVARPVVSGFDFVLALQLRTFHDSARHPTSRSLVAAAVERVCASNLQLRQLRSNLLQFWDARTRDLRR